MKELNDARRLCNVIFYANKLPSIFLAMLIAGCAITSSFNEENIDKLRIGMTATEVREMFGAPNQVSVSTCGGATASGAWICETWKYRTSSYRTNDFVFSVKQDSKVLNSWDVRR
jgi:hypothetical protein